MSEPESVQIITLEQAIKLCKSNLPRHTIQKFLREAFKHKENFKTFCEFIFPHAFSRAFEEFQQEVINDFTATGNKAVALPRGHGKSTLIGLGLVAWHTVNQNKKYIVYTSQNHSKSVTFLEPLRAEFRINPMLKFLYPELTVQKVASERGVDRQEMVDIGKTRLHALSFEKNIRGLKSGVTRPDLIILDDIEDDDRVINPDLRLKDEDKLNKQIIPAMASENGEYKFIGTILHHDSLLMKKLNLLGGKIYKAAELINPPVIRDGSIVENGEWSHVLWPQKFPANKLDELYVEMGSRAFESELLNNPIDDAKAIIKRDWLEAAFDTTLSYWDDNKGDLVIGEDFAFADRATSDKSAFVGLLKSAEGYTIKFCITEQGESVLEQLDYIEYLSGSQKAMDNALEENSVRNISSDLDKYTFPRTLFWMAANDPSPEALAKRKELNLTRKETRITVGKLGMVERMATQFQFGRIRLPYKTVEDQRITQRIVSELVTFSRKDGKLVEAGVHSDIGVALGLALERHEMDSFKLGFGFV